MAGQCDLKSFFGGIDGKNAFLQKGYFSGRYPLEPNPVRFGGYHININSLL